MLSFTEKDHTEQRQGDTIISKEWVDLWIGKLFQRRTFQRKIITWPFYDADQWKLRKCRRSRHDKRIVEDLFSAQENTKNHWLHFRSIVLHRDRPVWQIQGFERLSKEFFEILESD